MTALKERLLRRALSQVLKRPCPDRVPRSGEEGQGINCFTAYVYAYDGEPYLVVDSLHDDFIRGRRWDGKSFSLEADERVRNLLDKEVGIIHYYGLDKIEFTGAWDFLWHHYTGSFYIQIGARRTWQSVSHFVFNKRSLPSQRRLRILRLLISSHLSGKTDGLTTSDIKTEIYSTRWVDLPTPGSRKAELEFQLDSLLASGELEKVGSSYRATPKSLVTLDQIDEQERRHREALRLQLWIVILTFIIALAAMVQVLQR
jgi:hypothetical protein